MKIISDEDLKRLEEYKDMMVPVMAVVSTVFFGILSILLPIFFGIAVVRAIFKFL